MDPRLHCILPALLLRGISARADVDVVPAEPNETRLGGCRDPEGAVATELISINHRETMQDFIFILRPCGRVTRRRRFYNPTANSNENDDRKRHTGLPPRS